MSRYSQHFREANLVSAQQVRLLCSSVTQSHILCNTFLLFLLYLQISRLTAQLLSDMGITLVGHQKKILHQARQLDTII